MACASTAWRPPWWKTQMQAELAAGYAAARGRGESADSVRSRLVADVPVRRMATPDEVASVFAFLASDLASYVARDGAHRRRGVRIDRPARSAASYEGVSRPRAERSEALSKERSDCCRPARAEHRGSYVARSGHRRRRDRT